MTIHSREPQYQVQWDTAQSAGLVQMGPMASHVWRSDPRRLTFLLSRYKFVAKMLAGKESAVEVGCGDGFGMRVVLQTVGRVHGVDFDPAFVDWCTEHARAEGLAATFEACDLLERAPAGRFSAAYSLDVIEHVEPDSEPLFVRNLVAAVEARGIAIVGTPNATAEAHQSVWSREGHINLKSADSLKASLEPYFDHVFSFSMNDEVVHTGFAPMAHYLFAMGVGKRA